MPTFEVILKNLTDKRTPIGSTKTITVPAENTESAARTAMEDIRGQGLHGFCVSQIRQVE